MAKLTKSQAEVWDRLKNGLPSSNWALDHEYSIGTMAPASPVTGDIYCDTTDSTIYVYTGTAWTAVS